MLNIIFNNIDKTIIIIVFVITCLFLISAKNRIGNKQDIILGLSTSIPFLLGYIIIFLISISANFNGVTIFYILQYILVYFSMYQILDRKSIVFILSTINGIAVATLPLWGEGGGFLSWDAFIEIPLLIIFLVNFILCSVIIIIKIISDNI